MADNPTGGQGAAPKSPAATPSLQGITKPGQGTVPQTPGTGPTGVPPTPGQIGSANLTAAGPRVAPGEVSLVNANETGSMVSEDAATRTAPAAHIGQITERRKAMEARLKQMQDDKSGRDARARAMVAAQLAELKDIEARQHGGYNDLTPAGNLLNVDGRIHEQFPDDHLRWVNEAAPGRAAFLQSRGYTRVPGQIPGGDTVLWKIPRERWAKNQAVKDEQTDRGLRKATSQNRDDTVQELQTFFDKHGVKIDANDILLKDRG